MGKLFKKTPNFVHVARTSLLESQSSPFKKVEADEDLRDQIDGLRKIVEKFTFIEFNDFYPRQEFA